MNRRRAESDKAASADGTTADAARNSAAGNLTAYQRQVSEILLERFNRLLGQAPQGEETVTVRLRVARDGRVTALSGGQVSESDLVSRSSNEAVNKAAVAAINQAALPPLPGATESSPPIVLTIQFLPRRPQ
jgi:hypothetical protein